MDRRAFKDVFKKSPLTMDTFRSSLLLLQGVGKSMGEIDIHIYYALTSLLGGLVTIMANTPTGESIVVNEYIADKIIDDYILLASCSGESYSKLHNHIVQTCIQVVVNAISL
jgi:hypothetical protein